ncbi:hypothetical protein LEN26_011193 [Aphanomyces euteiches]|nr:hypothetical protein LEN26_011193 [Aphanomyces euteiches]
MSIDHLAIEHVFGNFHDYYDFNPESDRLRFLSPQVHRAIRRYFLEQPGKKGTLLDVGCNEGKLTIGLYNALTSSASSSMAEREVFSTDAITQLNDILQQQHLPPPLYITIGEDGTGHRPEFTIYVYVYGEIFFGEGRGVSKKVARAKAAFEAVARWQSIHSTATLPADPQAMDTKDEIQAIEKDNSIDLQVLGVDIDGVLIDRATKRYDSNSNVTFATGDIMKPTERARLFGPVLTDRERFDLVTCFSVTMWIHLNHGDAGLCSFLDAVSNVAEHLIVEPQPWKCYRTAMARLKRKHIRNPFQPIKHTTDVVEFIETKLAEHFPHRMLLGKTNWSRHVWLYSRTSLPALEYTK